MQVKSLNVQHSMLISGKTRSMGSFRIVARSKRCFEIQGLFW